MQKLIGAGLLLVILAALNSKAFATSMNCTVKSGQVDGIQSLHLADEGLIVNDSAVIALEHSRIKCGSLGRQDRFDGAANGYQVILKSCANNGALEGIIIDSVKSKVAEVICD